MMKRRRRAEKEVPNADIESPKPESKVRSCYVCGHPIRENAQQIGPDMFRHKVKCAPGTRKYLANPELKKLWDAAFKRKTDKEDSE